MTDAPALEPDSSRRLTWSGDYIDKAVFRLRADADSVTGPSEGDVIEAVLSHPAAERMQSLELHLTDYDRSAEQAAVALAACERPRLERLYLGYDFTYLFEDSAGSDGLSINPLDFHDKGLIQTDFWHALPALRAVELQGAFLVHSIDHDSLLRLRTRGSVMSDGAVFALGSLPALESLEVEIRSDVFGVACSVEQIEELSAEAYPALRRLDLGRSEFDDSAFAVLTALSETSVLPQLETLVIPSLEIEQWQCGGEPLAALTELAPRFEHLVLSVAGEVAVEGADAGDVERLLAGFGAAG